MWSLTQVKKWETVSCDGWVSNIIRFPRPHFSQSSSEGARRIFLNVCTFHSDMLLVINLLNGDCKSSEQRLLGKQREGRSFFIKLSIFLGTPTPPLYLFPLCVQTAMVC